MYTALPSYIGTWDALTVILILSSTENVKKFKLLGCVNISNGKIWTSIISQILNFGLIYTSNQSLASGS